MKKVIIWTFAVMGICTACQKTEFLDAEIGDPVFEMQFEFDQQVYAWKAGINNFFMFTSQEDQDNGTVLESRGELAKDSNCQDQCQQGLSIWFTQNSSFGDPSNLAAGMYPYASSDTMPTELTFYTILLSASTTGVPPFTYEWLVEGVGTYTQGPNLQLLIPEDEIFDLYYVRLTTTDALGCTSEYEQFIPIFGNPTPAFCDPRFEVAYDSELDSVYFSALQPNFEGDFNWSLPGFNGPNHQLSSAQVDTQVCLQFLLPPDCNATYCEKLSIQSGELQRCGTFFTTAVDQFTEITPTPTSDGVWIELSIYENDQPVVYSLRPDIPQPSGSFFRIISEAPYLNNADGQPTQRLEIEFQCQLHNAAGQAKTLSNARGFFGIGSLD